MTGRRRRPRRGLAAVFAALAFAGLALVALVQRTWAESAHAAQLILDAGHSAGDGLGTLTVGAMALLDAVRSRRTSATRWAACDLDLCAKRLTVFFMCVTVVGVVHAADGLQAVHDDRFDLVVLAGGGVGFAGNAIVAGLLLIGRSITGWESLGSDAKHAAVDAVGSILVVVSALVPRSLAIAATPLMVAVIVGIVLHTAHDARLLPRRSCAPPLH